MQSELYLLEDEIADFNALVNLTADGDIIQVLGCPVSVSRAPEAAKIRQWPSSSFWDKSFWDRKDNAYKLYHGQFTDLCDTFEKYCIGFSATQLQIHDSNNNIQTLVLPESGTNPSEKCDHYCKSSESAQPF